jgi:hypothetical protein
MTKRLYDKLLKGLFNFSYKISEEKALSLVQEHLKLDPDDRTAEIFLIVIHQFRNNYLDCNPIFEKYINEEIEIPKNKYTEYLIKWLSTQGEFLIQENLLLEAINLIDFLNQYEILCPRIKFVRFQSEIITGDIQLGMKLLNEYLDSEISLIERFRVFETLSKLLNHSDIENSIKTKIGGIFFIPYSGKGSEFILRKITCRYKVKTELIIASASTEYTFSFIVELPNREIYTKIICPICKKEISIENYKNKLKINSKWKSLMTGNKHISDGKFNKISVPYKARTE